MNIFEFLHPGAVGVFVFDCSSAHEAFAENALNVNNMNINPGGRGQRKLRNTTIPLDNPAPQHNGVPDTRGMTQSMVFPDDHPKYPGQPKGMLQVLRERASVWHQFTNGGTKSVVGHCKNCKLSQAKRDALARVAAAESAGHDNDIRNDLDDLADNVPPPKDDEWCCAKQVLSRQQDFVEEKSLLQHRIEERGHKCLFLPKFHCELNAIELYWGFAKYREPFFHCYYLDAHILSDYREASDGRFKTAQELVPQCLNLCSVETIRRYFRKCWRYMDAYRSFPFIILIFSYIFTYYNLLHRKGLSFKESNYIVKKYKSHRRIPEAAFLQVAAERA